MARVVSVHEVELHEGVASADFERFVVEEFLTALALPGVTAHLCKGDWGERGGKYALIMEIDSLEARNRYFPRMNEVSEEGRQLLEPVFALMEKWASFSPTVPGQNTPHTDYVLVGA